LIILGIETSGKVGGVALCDGEELIEQTAFRSGMVHGKALVPAVSRLLSKNKIAPAEVHAIAVSAGPGSYTGVRVGVTCAKTFCYVTGAHLVAVSTLDAMVQGVPKKYDTAAPILDARRGDVYTCVYQRTANGWQRQTELTAEKPQDAVTQLPAGAFVFGSGLARFPEIFAKSKLIAGTERYWWPKAKHVCALGLRAAQESRFEDALTFTPIYLRPSEYGKG